MSVSSLLRATVLAVSTMSLAPVYAADDATMHDVYLAAEAGKFSQAQSMMDKVLRDHPNSAKARFVEAELLAKQGLLSQAAAELGKAEQIAPGLPFAKPAAVERLRERLSGLRTPRSNVAPQAYGPRYNNSSAVRSTESSGLPWGLIFGGVGLIGCLILAMRYFAQRSSFAHSPSGSSHYGPAAPAQPYNSTVPQPYGYGAAGPGMPSAAPAGMGSGIMGGLATGAAIGAGVVAGEALMHHFTDDSGRRTESYVPPPRNDYPQQDDMGGNDFGVTDSSSWDDDKSGGDDDQW